MGVLPILLLFPSLVVAEAPVSFDYEIRPLLAARCILCHGNADESRRAGLRLDTQEGLLGPLRRGGRVVVPGDPEASGLYRRVSSTDPSSMEKLSDH